MMEPGKPVQLQHPHELRILFDTPASKTPTVVPSEDFDIQLRELVVSIGMLVKAEAAKQDKVYCSDQEMYVQARLWAAVHADLKWIEGNARAGEKPTAAGPASRF